MSKEPIEFNKQVQVKGNSFKNIVNVLVRAKHHRSVNPQKCIKQSNNFTFYWPRTSKSFQSSIMPYV
jgi:hypothetical protein